MGAHEGEGDQPFVLLQKMPREGGVHLITHTADRTSEGLARDLRIGQLEMVGGAGGAL